MSSSHLPAIFPLYIKTSCPFSRKIKSRLANGERLNKPANFVTTYTEARIFGKNITIKRVLNVAVS